MTLLRTDRDRPAPPVFNPQRLWIVMQRRRVTAPELAKLLKIRSSRMHRICLGISDPTPREIQKLSDVLNWPAGWFFKTEDLSFDWCSI